MSEYIREFNQIIQRNYKNVSEETLKYLGIIASTNDFLKLENPEVPSFFINLHCILSHTDNDSIINHCFTILEHAVKETKVRETLIYDYKFVPVIAQILYRLTGENTRVLVLLEELTYGIYFDQQEFYLDALMKYLIDLIVKQSDNSESAFAVLINLCFKNEECMYLVLRLIKIKDLAKLVSSYGIYTWKFYLIFDYKPNPHMISQQITMSFDEIESAFTEFDHVRLRHILDFMLKANELAGGQKFDGVLKEKIIDKISILSENEIMTSDEANRDNKLKCISLLFLLLEQMMSSTMDQDLIDTLVEICLTWITVIPINVMKVITKVFQQQGIELNEEKCNRFNCQLSVILERIKEKQISSDEIIVSFDMILRLIKCPVTQTLVVNLVSVEFLENIIREIGSVFESGANTSETTAKLRLFVYVLNTLYELSNIDTQKYYGSFRSVMQNHATHKLLARAFVVKDANLYQMIFRMNRTSEFPLEEVSHILANQSFVCTDKCLNDSRKNLKVNVAPPTVELENRLDEMLDKLNKYPQQTLLTSEIIEGYKYNINSHLKKNEDLTMRLEQAEETIIRMSHENQLLNSQINKYQQDVFKNLLNYEAITKENQLMQEEIKTLRYSIQKFNQSYDAAKKKNIVLTENLEDTEKKLNKKIEECETLNEKWSKTKSKLEELSSDSKKRIEEFKQHFKTHESKLKTCQEENEKMSKAIKELEKQNAHLNDFVKSLEKQITVKDEQIKSYKEELQECDQMRQMIANVVTKRQKK